MNLTLLQPGLAERVASFVPGVLEATDVLLVDTVAARFGENRPDVLLALAFAVRGPRAGHIGVDLTRIAQTVDDERTQPRDPEPLLPPDWPIDALAWQRLALESPMVGGPHDKTPFVQQRLRSGQVLLMTRRMWQEQVLLAAQIAALATPVDRPLAADVIDAGLAALDVQGEAAQAVRVALARGLTVVTGGPGTGKTFSIKRLLALLLEHDDPTRPLNIQLAAPTGKAAVRMAEAIAEGLDALPGVTERTRQRLAQLQPRTLHKLLGARPDGSARHHAGHPLEADVIVVDEASMVDLTLMRRLLDAVPQHARLILLGDRDQLASVEAGTVLADLVQGADTDDDTPLRASIVRFTASRRFASAPTIGAIARGLQQGDAQGLQDALLLLNGQAPLNGQVPAAEMPGRVQWLGAPAQGRPTPAQLDALAQPYLTGYVALLHAALAQHGRRGKALEHPDFHAQALLLFGQYRVLAVHRNGPLGVAGLERALAQRVRTDLGVDVPAKLGFWLGQPLLVTQNAYDVGLMNGDIGLVLPTADGLQAIFARTVAGVQTVRAVPLVRLPQLAGALAMTVHKSQGSQFARVALVLADRDSPIQTRELVYTGLTRASEQLDWLGAPPILATALERRVSRASGLAELLWQVPMP
jgi:exodeoxyribonuclease V alpha subunit